MRRSEIGGDPWPRYAELADRIPPGTSWGVFPQDPGRGTANFAGAAEARDAAASVRTGQVFNLDHGLKDFDPPMARARSGPVHKILSAHPQSRDDVLHELYLQASTQIDGLRHRRASGHGFYDGVRDEDVAAGTPQLGIQLLAQRPVVGRGILLDVDGLRAAQGMPLDHRSGPVLEASELDAACVRQGVEIRPGDIVLVHTGWARWFLDADPRLRAEVRDARRATGFRQSTDLPAWIWDHRVAVFATDTFAVEVLPVVPGSDFLDTAPEDAGMMHQELIAKLGAVLGELWNLDEIVEDSRRSGRWDALCIIKPLNLLGGVGSPANATAIR